MTCSLVLGVDGGNSKTVALLALSDGTVVGAGRAGCSDIYGAISADAAIREVHTAVAEALANARAEPGSISASAFSMAGADWPDDYALLAEALGACGLGHIIVVVNDALGALRAGSIAGTGVAVVVGTGAATGARGPLGIWHHSWWQEPQGSLHLADRALRAVYRAELGLDPPTSLTARVLQIHDVDSVDQVLYARTRRTGRGPDMRAQLARALLDEADGDDPVAQHIVCSHGQSLGQYAVAAARKVGFRSDASFPLVLSGGVFRHPGSLLADALTDRVRLEYSRICPARSRLEPVAGAVLLGLERAGVAIGPEILARLTATLPTERLYAT